MLKPVFKKMACPLCVLICIISLSSPCMGAMAIDNNGRIELQMVNINDAVCSLAVKNGKASATIDVSGKLGAEKCRIVLEIQEKDGNSWITVGSWTVTKDGRNAAISESVYTESGKTYRAKATVTVWLDGTSESKTITTTGKTA